MGHPPNPLRARLKELGLGQTQLFEASAGKLDRARISVLCREIPAAAGSPKATAPRVETLDLVHRVLLQLDGSATGLPPEAWENFLAALKAQRALVDRRRKTVREHSSSAAA